MKTSPKLLTYITVSQVYSREVAGAYGPLACPNLPAREHTDHQQRPSCGDTRRYLIMHQQDILQRFRAGGMQFVPPLRGASITL